MENESAGTGSDSLVPSVIYEDDDLLVIDKPTGLVVHGDGKRSVSTVADWLIATRPFINDVGEPTVLSSGARILRPGIVHRLDKETSGVMVVAKHQEAYEFLKRQFQERAVRKIYHACVYGLVKQDKGVIDFAIGRSRKDFRLRSAQPRAKGDLRDAVTHFQVVVRGLEHTYLELEPKTGRTHQIRVHLKAIHHPIVGDALYAPRKPLDLGFSRMALHAYRLIVPMMKGGARTFEAPLPEEFVRAGDRMRQDALHLRDE